MVYVDPEHCCHVTNPDGLYRAVEHPFFKDRCQTFVEGYRYDDGKGYVQIYPWEPASELFAAQAQYEADLVEAEAAYQEGVNSAYDQ